MIQEIVRITGYLLPIPFMALFYIKTDKLNFLKKYQILTLFIPIFMQLIFGDLGYNIELIFAYVILVLLGTTIFNEKGWTYPQALSLSFCLVFFGSFLWELPILTYTIIIRGGIDGAFPLHLLFIFPMVFVYEKVKTNKKRINNLNLLLVMMVCSSIGLLVLITSKVDIWNIVQSRMSDQVFAQTLWMVNRVIVIGGLFAIYIKSSLRKEIKM